MTIPASDLERLKIDMMFTLVLIRDLLKVAVHSCEILFDITGTVKPVLAKVDLPVGKIIASLVRLSIKMLSPGRYCYKFALRIIA